MSALQKSMLRGKMPPKPEKSRIMPGTARRKDYSPLSWKKFFEKHLDVETENGRFRVYMTAEPKDFYRPRIFALHGGGYSALSWAPFAHEVTSMVECQVIAMDMRGHGETFANDPDDMSANTLTRDVELVIHAMFPEEKPRIILMGHSMGGAISVRVAMLDSILPLLEGLAVIDVVEGTAMDALASMQSFLRSRPSHFRSVQHAIEWCVRSGQVRNVESARVSMPSQIINIETGLLAIHEVDNYQAVEEEPTALLPTRHPMLPDRIVEEEEDDIDKGSDQPPEHPKKSEAQQTSQMTLPVFQTDSQHRPQGESAETSQENEASAQAQADSETCTQGPQNKVMKTDNATSKDAPASSSFATPSPRAGTSSIKTQASLNSKEYIRPAPSGDGSRSRNLADMKYKWRIDLSRTEHHWPGWFKGLSSAFLNVKVPRVLLLASIDGLDKELMVGQMQGKFQLQVLTRCGHAVHEDNPSEVARAIASFAIRYKLTEATPHGDTLNLHGRPGC